MMSVQVTGFDRLREDYESRLDFGSFFHSMQSNQPMRSREFMIQDEYLFRGMRLCLHCTLMRHFDLGGACRWRGWSFQLRQDHCFSWWSFLFAQFEMGSGESDWVVSYLLTGEAEEVKSTFVFPFASSSQSMTRCEHRLRVGLSSFPDVVQFRDGYSGSFL